MLGLFFSGFLQFILSGSPTILLLVLVIACRSNALPRYRWSIVVALGLSEVAHSLLGKGLFVPGVIVFMTANIAYLVAFTTEASFAKHKAPFACFGIFCSLILAVVVWKFPVDYLIPVLLYCVSIVSVPSQAFVRNMVIQQESTLWAVVGSMLLLISDAAIPIDMFFGKGPWLGQFVMFTYFGGQWLIVASVLNAEKKWQATPFRVVNVEE
jgi:uncharacterized membrane protein YhhN